MNSELPNNNSPITLIECPRDAMQGWHQFIPTERKIAYLNSLLQVGFDTIDFGSFVSQKLIPQMADTKEVIRNLYLGNSKTKLLAIVANVRGAEEAVAFDEISYLGFPFSLSQTFQLRNTNSSMEESLNRVDAIQELCIKNKKELVIYLSMGFGNPYGDVYTDEILLYWADQMVQKDIHILSLADTIGIASEARISFALETLIPKYNETTIGVHLHSSSKNWETKMDAAVKAGCKRFDGTLKGIGGCPMAQDHLIGNMDTELMISYCKESGYLQEFNEDALLKSLQIASEIFT